MTFDFPQLEIRKGCALKEVFRSDDNAVLDQKRKCFTSKVASQVIGARNLTMVARELAEVMDFANLESATMREQYESCYCFGSFCNSASSVTISLILTVTAFLSIFLK